MVLQENETQIINIGNRKDNIVQIYLHQNIK